MLHRFCVKDKLVPIFETNYFLSITDVLSMLKTSCTGNEIMYALHVFITYKKNK